MYVYNYALRLSLSYHIIQRMYTLQSYLGTEGREVFSPDQEEPGGGGAPDEAPPTTLPVVEELLGEEALGSSRGAESGREGWSGGTGPGEGGVKICNDIQTYIHIHQRHM